MPIEPPKTALGRTLPAVEKTPKSAKLVKAKAKPPRDLRMKTPPRAAKRMNIPGKAGGR
ncbi:hypothetical protein [Ruegeria atlantica]|uniref:Uncharacterized protein n=1 Tax=Ruegeria atlantica TaxID=81569 RepID=A0A0P1ECS1_9RHOB|nr:hypothetical protein [Ruegeria atlantica]CUH47491.1 hypothetical protein RUA4292_01662 [Ruegeria atlantica]